MRVLEVLRKYYVLFFIAGLFFFWTSEIIYRNLKILCLEKYSIQTKAIIINEKDYFGNSPVSKEFSYSFLFTVKEKNYKGNSHNTSLNIGDTITVEYVSFYPNFNRVLNQKK